MLLDYFINGDKHKMFIFLLYIEMYYSNEYPLLCLI